MRPFIPQATIVCVLCACVCVCMDMYVCVSCVYSFGGAKGDLGAWHMQESSSYTRLLLFFKSNFGGFMCLGDIVYTALVIYGT